MPVARERDERGRPASSADLVADDSRSVGFLDLADLDGDAVMERVLDGFARLDGQAVLTAYCTHVGPEAMHELCRPHEVEVVHAVAHETGTTFVMHRTSR